MAHAHQACWDYLGYGYVFAVWVICLLMQKQLADNLLAQVRKFRDRWPSWQKMLCAHKFPELILKTRSLAQRNLQGAAALTPERKR